MGKLHSKSRPKAEAGIKTEDELLDKPWRELIGWSNTERSKMRREVAELKPELHDPVEVQHFNILLTGQVKAGKSSFVNSVLSLYRERMMNKAEVGSRAHSLTKHFRIYTVSEKPTSKPFSWRICDTMGLEHTEGINADHILAAVDGKIPDKYEFTESVLHPESPGLNSNPTLADKAHCVAIVVDAAMYKQMKGGIWKKLKLVREGLLSRGIPFFILLTKIDDLCPHVKDDVTMVYRSTAVLEAVENTSKKLYDLSKNHIFPIRNYCHEVEFDAAKDILLLYAVRHMLYAAQGYLEEKQDSRPDSQAVEN